jgi:hypothetical protein
MTCLLALGSSLSEMKSRQGAHFRRNAVGCFAFAASKTFEVFFNAKFDHRDSRIGNSLFDVSSPRHLRSIPYLGGLCLRAVAVKRR